MDIACPTCATSYEIDDATVTETGRKVRCAVCTTVWRQFNDRPVEIISAPENAARADVPLIADAPPLYPEPADLSGPLTDARTDGTDAPPRKARLIKAKPSGKSGRALAARLLSWPVAVVIITGAIAAMGMFQRERVVRLMPQSASLFAAIGMPVNLRGIDIRDVKSRMVEDNGVSVLVIDGNLVSLARERVNVPRLRFAVLGDKGQEIYVWTAQADRPTLQPGESLNFRRRLAAPPSDGKGVQVRFLAASDITAGLK